LPVLKKRSRLVSFRLPADQYEALRGFCASTGARSVSDFTRTAVLQEMKKQSSPSSIWAQDLAELGHQLDDLDQALSEMKQVIRRVLGPKAAGR